MQRARPMSFSLTSFVFPFILVVAILMAAGTSGHADSSFYKKKPEPAVDGKSISKEELEQAKITDRTGQQLNLAGMTFKDEQGQAVALSQFFTGKEPVILVMAYYKCASLCTFVLNGVATALRGLNWDAGQQYRVVAVSINPRESSALAAEKKAAYMKTYARIGAEKGWHFLTGDENQIKNLASQVGFGYSYDKEHDEYAHSAGIFILTPEGKISRTLYGIEFPVRDLKLALLEASDGKVGNVVERLLMLCYRYDVNAKGYAVYAFRLMQLAGLFTMAAIGGYILFLVRTERRRPVQSA